MSIITGAGFAAAVLISSLSIWTMNATSRLRDAIEAGNGLVSTALRLHGQMKDLMFELFTPQTYHLLKDVLHTMRFQSTRRNFDASVQEFQQSMAEFMQSDAVKGLLRDQELRDTYDTLGIMTNKALERITSFQAAVDRLYASGVTEDSELYRLVQADPATGVSLFFDEVRSTSDYLSNSFEGFLSHFIRSLQAEGDLMRRQLMLAFWSLTAFIGAAAIALSLLFSHRVAQRISSVERGVRAVAHGDFGARLSIRTTDEFGVLAQNFNLLMQELKKNVDAIQNLMRDVGESLTTHPGFQRILELIVEAAVKDSNADGAAVIVPDAERGVAVASAAGDFPSALDAGEERARLGAIIEKRERVFIPRPLALGGRQVMSLLALPLSTTQGTVGALYVITVPPQPALTDLDFTTFGSFADYAALIIDNFFKYTELLGKREAEYRALQAQIQPHFLYNVLNGLVGLNRMGDAKTLESALFSLKDMLRYILDSRRWTSVRDELSFVSRYCGLQRLRFADRLSVDIRCDGRAGECLIPKLLLQPIVENAVIHGIEPLDRPGALCVEASLSGADGSGLLVISVTDNGMGCPGGGREVEERIGLSNVRERLGMAYPGSRLRMDSSPGAGTRITLEMPQGTEKK